MARTIRIKLYISRQCTYFVDSKRDNNNRVWGIYTHTNTYAHTKRHNGGAYRLYNVVDDITVADDAKRLWHSLENISAANNAINVNEKMRTQTNERFWWAFSSHLLFLIDFSYSTQFSFVSFLRWFFIYFFFVFRFSLFVLFSCSFSFKTSHFIKRIV